MTDPRHETLAVREGERLIDTRADTTTGCAVLAMGAVDGMAAGDSFVLVADHDPRGIHYMLEAERPGVTTWEPLEEGPERWQIRIAAAADAGA